MTDDFHDPQWQPADAYRAAALTAFDAAYEHLLRTGAVNCQTDVGAKAREKFQDAYAILTNQGIPNAK